jgi:hypothetical protein
MISLILQGFLATTITSCTLVLTAAAFRYARASAAERVLIADAPHEGENVIPFRSTRLRAQGSKLSFQASHPSRGGK